MPWRNPPTALPLNIYTFQENSNSIKISKQMQIMFNLNIYRLFFFKAFKLELDVEQQNWWHLNGNFTSQPN